ncbi:hypothetical protein QVZ43_09790 [Marinobacter sp. chi1]|uniref:Uncharacterized protein n=1 Tax=Marinobacter suaedae TaxID=3057675 RepID=A0ABT8W190_9GAMM|nr:hypothetical protein [Marinobacter sp. chi1]MDO3722014.1 hypothetical protein [Marinobacter sp. chi1]
MTQPSLAGEAFASQSYESCSLVTSEYLTVLQLADRGLDLQTLSTSLLDLSDPGAQRLEAILALANREGIVEAHSAVHSEYARCARGVYEYRGIPAAGSREHHFHQCAGENKSRYEIGLAATLQANPANVAAQLSPEHKDAVTKIFDTFESQGAGVLFDALASELKRCLKNSG